jgi:hypothetical protein
MLKGNKPEGGDFTPHPEGRFNGIVYCFKGYPRRGEKDAWGNDTKHKCMIRIESIDCTIDDVESEYHGKPQSVGLFFNYSWGDDTKRSGNYYPAMQENRETILDRKLTTEEWYEFDPHELMGSRVRYRVQHDPKDNPKSDNDVWVNVKIIERLEDQTVGTQVNETVVDVTALESFPFTIEEGAPVGIKDPDHQSSPSQSSGPPASPAPPNPNRKPSMPMKAVEYTVDLIEVIVAGGLLTVKEGGEWKSYMSDPEMDTEEFKTQFLKLEKSATDNGIELPPCEVHPLSTGEDELPL